MTLRQLIDGIQGQMELQEALMLLKIPPGFFSNAKKKGSISCAAWALLRILNQYPNILLDLENKHYEEIK